MIVSGQNKMSLRSINFLFCPYGNLPYHLCADPKIIRLHLQLITYLTILKYLTELIFFLNLNPERVFITALYLK